MKLGLERERFGDIIVFEEEAYILVLAENAEYVCENLKYLTKFKKSKIDVIEIEDIKVKQVEFEEIKVVVTSNRVDNFVSEISKCSRSTAEELILNERVLMNHVLETKPSKGVKLGDILTIRGKGKYLIHEYVGENKKGRKIYLIQKYV